MPVEDASDLVKRLPSSEYIRQYFHRYASEAHLAGSPNDKAQAEWTRDQFIELGIKDTQIETYYPYLNTPKQRRLAIVDGPQELLYEAALQEEPVAEDGDDENSVPTFHGYSADGNVTGPVVYAAFGRPSDFQALATQGIKLQGTIALMRHGGGMSRGLKIKAAQEFGCIGALLYSDPQDDGPLHKRTTDGKPAQPYPNGPWRSSSSVERGTVHFLSIMPGDPLTPGYAATENATRISLNETDCIPKIPSLPISWEDAHPLLKATHSFGVQDLGDGYFSGPSEALVNLVNLNDYKTAPVWNVIGRIPGNEEPHRAVILGNHRDAWGFGGADPSSGSAALMELARVLGLLVDQGWRPRRTIILASWDAEEYGTVGSVEWVEDHKAWLTDEAVAYINVDVAVTGPHFTAQSSPILNQLLYEVTDEVIDPRTSMSVLQAWKADRQHAAEYGELATALARPLGAGSDYVGFMSHVGVSSLTMSFRGDYGVYHSNYDG